MKSQEDFFLLPCFVVNYCSRRILRSRVGLLRYDKSSTIDIGAIDTAMPPISCKQCIRALEVVSIASFLD